MFVTAGAQLFGAARGLWVGFAWILGPWISGILFLAGVIHMIASHFAARYKREGIREWLYASTWGQGSLAWNDSDEGQKNEWRALMEILLRPSVKLTGITNVTFDSSNMSYYGVGDIARTYQGCWIQVAFPALLTGETVKLSENVRGGFWAPAGSYEQGPTQEGDRGAVLPADAYYDADDVRVWQAWVPASELAENDPFILTVDYSETLLSSNEGRSNFTFYKNKTSKVKDGIEPNSEEGRGISVPTPYQLTIPMNLEA